MIQIDRSVFVCYCLFGGGKMRFLLRFLSFAISGALVGFVVGALVCMSVYGYDNVHEGKGMWDSFEAKFSLAGAIIGGLVGPLTYKRKNDGEEDEVDGAELHKAGDHCEGCPDNEIKLEEGEVCWDDTHCPLCPESDIHLS